MAEVNGNEQVSNTSTSSSNGGGKSEHTRSSIPSTVSSPTRKSEQSTPRLRRGERAFAVLFAPLCVAAFFAARSFGQQLKASGYAEEIQSTYDKVIEFIPTAVVADDAADNVLNPDLLVINSNASTFDSSSRHYGIQRNRTKRTVYILPQKPPNPAAAGEWRHFIQDAVQRSSFLEETHDPLDQDAAWVYDPVRLKWTLAIEIVRNVTNDRIARFGRENYRPWEFFLMDYNDDGFAFWNRLGEGIKEAMQSDSPVLRFATRRHVYKRALDEPKNDGDHFAPLGEAIDWANHKQIGSIYGVPRILRYGVRTDLVEHLEKKFDGGTFYEAEVENTTTSTGRGRQLIDLVALDRPVDVFSPWRIGMDVNLAKHRNGIAQALQVISAEYNGANGDATKPKLEMLLEPVGQRARPGRNSVQADYVDALLRSKIVITSQRDRWEDHYRLMEGLACGTLVFTDPMSTLPHHLKDGESLVVYRSISELKEKILYYVEHEDERLTIARKGHHIAMNNHRSWHGLERIIFGDWSKPMGRRRRRKRRLR